MGDRRLIVVVMTKPATPGRVKTRLIGRLSAAQAAAVHEAMLRCVLTRLAVHFGAARLVLAVDAAAGELGRFREALGGEIAAWECVPQGGGDLGDRMERLWREMAVEKAGDADPSKSGPPPLREGLGEGDEPTGNGSRCGDGDELSNHDLHSDVHEKPTPPSPSPSPSLKGGGQADRGAGLPPKSPVCSPIVFFGVDSPDAPAALLASLPGKLQLADVVFGRSSDGGYWTLAARRFAPAVLRGIDWGTSKVYDQSVAAARSAGLTVADAGDFHDVDEPADLDALLARLETATEPALVQLRDQLHRIITQGESS